MTRYRTRPREVDAAARFLMDRIDEMDFSLSMEDFTRDWYGHVEPAFERFKHAIDAWLPTPPGTAS